MRFFLSAKDVETDEVAGEATEYDSGSGSEYESGSAVGLMGSKSKENIHSTFSEITQAFEVKGNKTKMRGFNILNNTNIFKTQNALSNNSTKLQKNIKPTYETIKKHTFKNLTIRNSEDYSTEGDQNIIRFNISMGNNSAVEEMSRKFYHFYAANEANRSSLLSRDKNEYEKSSNEKVTEKTVNKIKRKTQREKQDKKEKILRVVTDMAKAANESIQIDDSDSIVKKSKINFPEGTITKENALMKNIFEKEKNSLPVSEIY